MGDSRIIHVAAMLVLVVMAMFTQAAARAETPVGSNVDSRVLVGFKANADAVGQMLPEGWSPLPFPAGPLKGANLLVVFIDRAIDLDPEGKPKNPATSRAMALVGLGKQTGGDAVHLYVMRMYSTASNYDPYGNASVADITRQTSSGGPANDGRERNDTWHVAPEAGGAIDLSLGYTSGKAVWSSDEARPYSNVRPAFSRIYRYDQLVHLVMSAAVGKPLKGEYAFTSTIAELAGVFDGSQETIAIIDVPVYVRKISLP
jgi:hypothetical protein